jgi:ring-1,2-phenylacetyl-CoA epoxidase subunit PaaB
MNKLESLDPRIGRLHIPEEFGTSFTNTKNDQFITYEVFVQPKADKSYQHEGIVHAPSVEMAFLFAKEQFSRRGISCSGVWVVKTDEIQVSPLTENKEDIYEYIHKEIMEDANKGKETTYQIFHLLKRGKHHQHKGELVATSFEEALWLSKDKFPRDKAVYNIWVAADANILKMEGEEVSDIWETLPDKKYRDAMDYKATEKIKKFKAEQKS